MAQGGADIEITGLDPLIRAMDAYPAVVGEELERTTEAALLSLVPDLSEYPSPPAGSTYPRSGNLGRGWLGAVPEFTSMSSGFDAVMGNDLARSPDGGSYGPYVQDEEEQAEVHQGRWQTAQDVLQDHQREIEEYYDVAMERVARKLEGGI
jgi:hypothetical protein